MDALNFLDTEDLVVLYADILIAQGQKNDFVSYAILKEIYAENFNSIAGSCKHRK